MAPTFARKMGDSRILELACSIIKQNNKESEKIFVHIMILVGDICREVPNLVEKLIEIGLMEAILQRLNALEIPTDIETVPMVIYFVNMLCLNSNGMKLEMKYGIISKVFDLVVSEKCVNEFYGSENSILLGKCPGVMAVEFVELISSVDMKVFFFNYLTIYMLQKLDF